MNKSILDIKNLFYTYPDGNIAITDLSFNINSGESIAIIGCNGAGKSTLLNLISGVFDSNEGSIFLESTEITKKNLKIMRQKIGMVFQNPDDQLFTMSVYDDVAFGPRNLKMSDDEVHRCVVDSLNKVGIIHLKDRAPYKLSGGEKRAAAIATVLSMDPKVLIMDEPSSALDPRARKRLISILASLEQTKLIATHDLEMALEICDRTIIMSNGRIIADGPTNEVLTNKDVMTSCGFDIPYSLKGCPRCDNSNN